jgi:hypothetical protein
MDNREIFSITRLLSVYTKEEEILWLLILKIIAGWLVLGAMEIMVFSQIVEAEKRRNGRDKLCEKLNSDNL